MIIDNDDRRDADMGLEQEERLPWLEPVDDTRYDDGVSSSRLIGLVLSGLALIGLIVGGLWWWQQNGGRPRGELIAAPEGEYRLPPPEEKGRFDGEGDVAVAAAEGATPAGRVDPSRLPEQPVERPSAAAREPAGRPAAASGRPAAAAAPAAANAAANAPTGGTVIQLGAFASEATAARAWSGLQGRFTWLANINRTVTPATVNGRTVYRLRATAGSTASARDYCSRLRVAGENCIVLP